MSKTIKVKDLFGNILEVEPTRNRDGSYRKNPLLAVFGKGPEGERCKRCVHFRRKRYGKVYFKCGLRGDTNGTATDHRANWPACGRFQGAVEKE